MNKENKFRYYDSVLKTMIYSDTFPNECESGDKSIYQQLVHFFNKAKYYAIDVQQYTGLKDKNGKEIYAGDILKILSNRHNERDRYCKVFWCEVKSMFCVQSGFDEDYLFIIFDHNLVEVIGNIFENPEFLEK